MVEHRAVIGARLVGFAAARQLRAAEATVLTGCTISSPTRVAACIANPKANQIGGFWL